MPQFGLLLIHADPAAAAGGTTPRESMPVVVQDLMLAAPTTHFTELSQAILTAVPGWRWWVQFLALAVIGSVLFGLSLARFRRTISQMA
jgi:ABC-2 type transport system permease protein